MGFVEELMVSRGESKEMFLRVGSLEDRGSEFIQKISVTVKSVGLRHIFLQNHFNRSNGLILEKRQQLFCCGFCSPSRKGAGHFRPFVLLKGLQIE